MAARFLLNATYDIETGQLLSHEGESFESAAILFDRGAVKQAKNLGQTNQAIAGQAGGEATQERASVLPGIEQAANNPTGYRPTDLNNMLVASQEGAGGANAAITGEGKLAQMRSRTAGGYSPALDEAARMKGRTLATNALDIQNMNAQLKERQQQQARNQLLGLYGTDTSNQLRAMGLSDQDLNTQLQAGRQGWQQNAMGWIQALKPSGSAGGMSFGG